MLKKTQAILKYIKFVNALGNDENQDEDYKIINDLFIKDDVNINNINRISHIFNALVDRIEILESMHFVFVLNNGG